MSTPTYELVDQGDCWAAVRDGDEVFSTWDREADPHGPGDYGLLTQMSYVVLQRWGRLPRWELTGRGWRAV